MSQAKNGKSFEYSLAVAISKHANAKIVVNDVYKTTQAYHLSLTHTNNIDRGADQTSVFLRCHDIHFDNSHTIMLQDDFQGRGGDVKVYCCNKSTIATDVEIGISAKHNHADVKHSRLSDSIDFGKKWCDCPVSRQYWKRIDPIFDDLRNRKAKGQMFNQINNKDAAVYFPILSAFEDELRRRYARTTESSS